MNSSYNSYLDLVAVVLLFSVCFLVFIHIPCLWIKSARALLSRVKETYRVTDCYLQGRR
jgi:hypothetical protein